MKRFNFSNLENPESTLQSCDLVSQIIGYMASNGEGYGELWFLLKTLSALFSQSHVLLAWFDVDDSRGGVVHRNHAPILLVDALQGWVSRQDTNSGDIDGLLFEKLMASVEIGDELFDCAGVRLNNGRLSAHIVIVSKAGNDSDWAMFQDRREDIERALELAVVVERRHINRACTLDSATSIANRDMFYAAADVEIEKSLGRERSLAVVILDLDRFLLVNHAFGPKVADEMLRLLAQRLVDLASPTDLVARLGGDEFAILVRDSDEIANLADGGSRWAAEIRKPIVVGEHTARVTGSIGMAVCTAETNHLHDLMRNAHMALMYVKRHGKDGARLYDEELTADIVSKILLEEELEKALDNEEFHLVYQPRVQMNGQVIESVEALIRWHHPKQGVIMPGDFIPVAEDGRLIIQIGDWVMYEVCRQLAEWRELTERLPRVAINVSPKQLVRQRFLAKLDRWMREFDIPATCLEIEITETALIEYGDEMFDTVNALREQGIKVAIDDFGTGYASLDALKRFSTDYLKIDRSFVQELSGRNKAIVSMIIQLAHQVDSQVIAEGVESLEQRDFLEDHGCDEMQGYLFSRPIPPQECLSLILDQTNLAGAIR